MIWLTDRERVALAILTALLIAALGLLAWQRRRSPISVVDAPAPPYAQWDAAIRQARTLNLNRASAAELERLPEIGPSLARRIVEHRQAHGPFSRAEDLQQVPGIGPKTFEALKDYVTVNE
jgi:competence protein ComEA